MPLTRFRPAVRPVPAELGVGVGALPVDALDRLTEELFDFSTLTDLERWLEDRHSP